MGKKWKRKIEKSDDGTELVVKADRNPQGRNDPPNTIDVFVNEDRPADIEYMVQGNLEFAGPGDDPASVIWKDGSDELPWTLPNKKKLIIQDDVDEVKNFNYRIGAYDKDGKWLLTPDPEIRNKRKPGS